MYVYIYIYIYIHTYYLYPGGAPKKTCRGEEVGPTSVEPSGSAPNLQDIGFRYSRSLPKHMMHRLSML